MDKVDCEENLNQEDCMDIVKKNIDNDESRVDSLTDANNNEGYYNDIDIIADLITHDNTNSMHLNAKNNPLDKSVANVVTDDVDNLKNICSNNESKLEIDESDSDTTESDSDISITGITKIDRFLLTVEEEESSSFVGPPRTKNEIDISKILPEVPNIKISPQDTLVPIGKIYAIIESESTVVIQSNVTSKPLIEGSILCLDNKHVLGEIFEMFGPVTTPFYIIKMSTPSLDEGLHTPKKSSPNDSTSSSIPPDIVTSEDNPPNSASTSSCSSTTFPLSTQQTTIAMEINNSNTEALPSNDITDENKVINLSENIDTDSSNNSITTDNVLDIMIDENINTTAVTTITTTTTTTTTTIAVEMVHNNNTTTDHIVTSTIPTPILTSSNDRSSDCADALTTQLLELKISDLKIGDTICSVLSYSKFITPSSLSTLKQNKGSDASNFYDEEVTQEEMEYSDDEQEQLAKKALKSNKRNLSDNSNSSNNRVFSVDSEASPNKSTNNSDTTSNNSLQKTNKRNINNNNSNTGYTQISSDFAPKSSNYQNINKNMNTVNQQHSFASNRRQNNSSLGQSYMGGATAVPNAASYSYGALPVPVVRPPPPLPQLPPHHYPGFSSLPVPSFSISGPTGYSAAPSAPQSPYYYPPTRGSPGPPLSRPPPPRQQPPVLYSYPSPVPPGSFPPPLPSSFSTLMNTNMGTYSSGGNFPLPPPLPLPYGDRGSSSSGSYPVPVNIVYPPLQANSYSTYPNTNTNPYTQPHQYHAYPVTTTNAAPPPAKLEAATLDVSQNNSNTQNRPVFPPQRPNYSSFPGY